MKITKEMLLLDMHNGLNYTDISKKYNVHPSYISILVNKKFKIKQKLEEAYLEKTFGLLTIKKRLENDRHSHAVWLCKCVCGKELPVVGHSLTSGNTTSCGCSSRQKGKAHKNFKGYEEISNSLWISIKNNAKTRGIKVLVTLKEIWELYLKQNRKCALTGLDIIFAKTRKTISDTTASLDRINSNKDYTIDNIQWVHKDINVMKQDFTEQQFLEYCQLVINYHKENKH